MRDGVIAVVCVFLATSSIAQAVPPYEQVLIPYDTSVTPGAYGARWGAEVRVRNAANVAVNLFPATCSWLGLQSPCDRKIEVPAATTSVLKVLTFPSSDPYGVLVYVPNEHTADIQFSLTVRDLAAADDVGTTVPIVRAAQFVTRSTIIGVPVSTGQRRTLRVYDPFLPTQAIFQVRVIDEENGVVLLDRQYMRGLPTDPAGPVLVPAMFDFADALSAPEVLAAQRVSVSIDRVFPPGLSFWPMITVTNNTDNHFAVFVPN
jgi:hypothetical protein